RLTEMAQAEVIRITIETLRRLKYQPTGGFTAFYLADPSQAGGFGLLDVDRRPKPGWQALADACRPVIVVADPLPSVVHPGTVLSLAVHVVSDLRTPLHDTTVRATVTQPDSEAHTTSWQGLVPSDSCAYIGQVEAVITAGAGDVTIDLELETNDTIVSNQYRSPIS
ncbi:MAG: hypothetical protein GY720_00260, partial [bacterium]|nr:hypothetical protein [bacterium]